MYQLPLPSGLIVEATNMHGRDVIAIAERVGGNASGAAIAQIMTSVTKRVVDPGPYPDLEARDGSPDWRRVLWGDLQVGILKLRIESFPEHRGICDFEFSCHYCRHLTDASSGEVPSVDLVAMLADEDHFRPLPQESAERLMRSAFFTATVPSSGQVVSFDLARLEQDEPMKVLMKRAGRKKETDVEVITKRIKAVSGLTTLKGEPVRDLGGFWRWTQGLTQNDLDVLLAAMLGADVFLDTRVLAWCTNPECLRQVRVALPFDQFFFRPRSATKKVSTEKVALSEPSSQGSTASGGTA